MADAMQGIMALPQGATSQAANDPRVMAAVEQMRKQISPQEVHSQLLDSAAEVDPASVAKFKSELQGLELPAEVLDMLNTLVESVLDSPNDYPAIRAKYLAQGIPEDLLPPTFDALFFGALNMAIDQLRANTTSAPAANTGPRTAAEILTHRPDQQAPEMPIAGMARGGIATLKPMAAAMARHGRNGDTMLAHINPAEARLLRKHGGSGTINPRTGLPEFSWLGDVFKKVGHAVKSFASSTIGKLVIGTALFMFAGPAVASFLNVAEGGIAAAGISGFVSGAGTALLGGSNLKTALKAGAISGITAGAVKGVTGAVGGAKTPTVDTATTTGAGEATSDTIRSALPDVGVTASDAAKAVDFQNYNFNPTPTTGFIPPPAQSMSFAPPNAGGIASLSSVPATTQNAAQQAATGASQTALDPLARAPGFTDSLKAAVDPNSGTSFTQGLKDAFLPGKGPSAEEILASKNIDPFSATTAQRAAAESMAKQLATGTMRSYAPLVGAGLGIAALAGGFDPIPSEMPPGFTGPTGKEYLAQHPELQLNFGGTRVTSAYNPYMSMYRAPVKEPVRAATGGAIHYPRKNGPISGPGTGTSDQVPAMLSDGEFVFTAKAVRAAGKGSRRAGAKRMLALMKHLEKQHG
jgi:hypothetical protein